MAQAECCALSCEDKRSGGRAKRGGGASGKAYQLERLDPRAAGRGDETLHLRAAVVPSDGGDVRVQADRVPASSPASSVRRHQGRARVGSPSAPGARHLDALLLPDLLLPFAQLERSALLRGDLLLERIAILHREHGGRAFVRGWGRLRWRRH